MLAGVLSTLSRGASCIDSIPHQKLPKRLSKLFIVALLCAAVMAQANNPLDSLEQPRTYQTARLTTPPPQIDGKIADEAWAAVAWTGDYIQRAPNEGAAPTHQTAFKILYDDKNLYIAFRCYDDEPEKIVRRLTRRDGFDGDWVEINIDSYNDKRTAFSFTITAAGVIGDEFVTNNGNNWDSNWNPIWYAKSNVDDEGWTAEMRIPLSQLRYGDQPVHTWGIQSTRYDFRTQERSVWRFISQNTAGWVSNFGSLEGIKGIKPQKQVEIQPYLLTQGEISEPENGNPFATGADGKISGGLDAKIGITSDLTLDLTVNPDFGQVEADPGAINLDGYQIFFSERRPFFIENRNIFDFQVTYAEAGGPFTRDNVFYSRRIGGAPSGYPNELSDNEYVDMPNNTTILGAAKFSGKTKSGTSIGILESVTQREVATISDGNRERTQIVEPLTNFFVGRVQQDFKGGNSFIGGMFTGVNRNLEGSYLADFMHRSAYTGAIDFMHRWNNQSWYVAGTGMVSRVAGTKEAITNTQTDFVHNFQRTDAPHLQVDENKTSLTGTGGTLRLGKVGGDFKFESGFTWRSPEVALNDAGFLRQADDITHYQWVGYRRINPTPWLNRWQVNYNHWFAWDFSGRSTHNGFNVNTHFQFKNFWGGGTGAFYQHYDISTRALRGGPSLRSPRSANYWWWFYTDQRKNIQFNFNGWQNFREENAGNSTGFSIWMNAQVTRTLQFSLGPDLTLSRDALQYVQNVDWNDATRYINGTIEQQTFGMTIRANYTITPNMSIQYYAQPFISRGNYTDFKYITDAGAATFSDRFAAFAENQISYDDENSEYIIDENADLQTDYTFGNPNFDFIQFRSNLVYRWEYLPGSTLFLVWTQNNDFFDSPLQPLEQPLIQDMSRHLFENTGRSIFLMKLTYRFF